MTENLASLDELPTMFARFDASGHVEWMNAAARSSEEIWSAIPAFRADVARVLATGKPTRGAAEGWRRGGETRWASLACAPLRDPAGTVVGAWAILHDVTEQKRADERLRANRQRLIEQHLALAAATRRVARCGGDLTQAIDHLLSLATGRVEVDRASLWMLDHSGQRLECQRRYDAVEVAFEQGDVILREENPAYFDALLTEEVVVVDDALVDPRTRGFADGYLVRHSVRALLDVPVVRNERVAGVLCLERTAPNRRWTREDALFASAVANLVTLAAEQQDRQRVEEALRASEERYALATQAGRAGVWDWDAKAGRLFLDPSLHAMFAPLAVPTPDQGADAWSHLVNPSDWPRLMEVGRDCRSGGACDLDLEFRVRAAHGGWRWVHVRGKAMAGMPVLGKPSSWSASPPLRFVGTATDITDRRVADDRMLASLAEKEVLLQEIHHRVKNNLQIVSSLLNLQLSEVSDPRAVAVIRESQARIRSMAMVHEALYRSRDAARVDLSQYVRRLSAELFRSFGVDAGRVRLDVEIRGATVPLNLAVPLGLFVNEVLANSFKYAFPEGRPGRVWVRCLVEPRGPEAVLEVGDDGVGLSASVDPSGSFGLRLLDMLADQLDGRLIREPAPGMVYRLAFPLGR